jgi:hypothetical protein
MGREKMVTSWVPTGKDGSMQVEEENWGAEKIDEWANEHMRTKDE